MGLQLFLSTKFVQTDGQDMVHF